MFFKLMVLFLLLRRFVESQQEDLSFTYNGFRGANLSLDGIAQITHNGLLMLTNGTELQKSYTFYPHPLNFKNLSTGNVYSFSTTFVFALFSEYATLGGPGIAFVITPSMRFPGALVGNFMGLFNETNLGNSSNHVIAIELDTAQNLDFKDINDNHVGIDINDLKSVKSAPASYISDDQDQQHHHNLTLASGQPMQLWVEYNGEKKQIDVTLAPFNVPKPTIPLLSLNYDLSGIIMDSMFVGFTAGTIKIQLNQYVLGWSFKMNGQAQELDLSKLPKLPPRGPKKESKVLSIGIPAMSAVLIVTIICIILYIMKRKKKFAEVLEDWELGYGPHRFKYKDLYIATKGFKDKELLGFGGFGRVYRGVLPTCKTEVAVKKISHDSRQGEREFIAEIVSIGKLRHRNIVTLLGYCRRKGELLLVYDFMPNGSLDKLLFHQSKTKPALNWTQRFQIIKNVASALLYLHEEWEQVVVHRDVKSSNVLLDKDMNGRLGDFGLARLYDHGSDPQTTHVVGTIGYLAPELSRMGKANPSTDVFSFGAFVLEVACGRKPIQLKESDESMVLVDWVLSLWSKGLILETVDPKLGTDYEVDEMEMVLKLGLLCSHSIPMGRPSMRQVLRYLEGEVPLPELSSVGLTTAIVGQNFVPSEDFSHVSVWNPSYLVASAKTTSSSIAESLLSGGR